MTLLHAALLLGAGTAAGFVAGLIGLGGGVIFAPVLLFYFKSTGVDPAAVAQLTAGSSLFCTLITASSSAWHHRRKASVLLGVALRVGACSALAVFLTTRFVTTSSWYDATAFQIVFSILLVGVVIRMLTGQEQEQQEHASTETGGTPVRHRWPLLAGTGIGAGTAAAAAGVGGGIVLVPAYNRLLHLPMEKAAGTSNATIVIISLVGVASYAIAGWGEAVSPTALGYVDLGRAALLAGPTLLSTRAGVWTAHHVRSKALRWSFAAVALALAGRMFYGALGA